MMVLRNKLHHTAGFTLLELSVVLVIIGIVSTMGIFVGLEQVESARAKSTRTKMKAIEDALMAFRTQNDRIPCPADITLPVTDVNFGIEAANQGLCTGGVPTANFDTGVDGQTAAGTVPVRTLGLPDEFMFDGWGYRISYAANRTLTFNGSFSNLPLKENCGGMTIRDAAGGNRTTGAAYVLVSHGKNRHGAFTRTGTRISNGSTSADELQNCDCDGSGTATAYNAIYVQKNEVITTTTTDRFDDIVVFKQRSQMQARKDLTEPYYDGASMVLADSTAAVNKIRVFTRQCDTFTEVAGPATMPPFSPTRILFSSDRRVFVAFHPGAGVVNEYFYTRSSGTTYTKINDLSPVPANPSSCYIFSPDATFLYRHSQVSDVMEVYKLLANTYTRINSNLFTDSAAWVTATNGECGNSSANGNFIAFNGDPPRVYMREDDYFSQLTLSPAPPAIPHLAKLSPDARYLTLLKADVFGFFPMSNWMKLYKRNLVTNVYEELVGEPASPPFVSNKWVQWSNDGRYIIGFNTSTFMYRRDGDSLTRLTTNPVFVGTSILRLGLGTNYLSRHRWGTNYIEIYRRSGENWFKLPNIVIPGLAGISGVELIE